MKLSIASLHVTIHVKQCIKIHICAAVQCTWVKFGLSFFGADLFFKLFAMNICKLNCCWQRQMLCSVNSALQKASCCEICKWTAAGYRPVNNIVAGVLTVLHLAQPIHLLVFAMSVEELYHLCLNLASRLQQLVRSAQRLQLIRSIFLLILEDIFVLRTHAKLIMIFWCIRGKEISYPASYK